MNKIFDILKNDDKPYVAIYDLFLSGELKTIFPELYDLYTDETGYKNNFTHTLIVLKNVCDAGYDYKMKLVAIFHDIGKSVTKKYTEKGWTFHNHEVIGARMTLMILDKCGIFDKELKDYLYRMILHHGRTKVHRDITESAIRRLDIEVGQDIIFDLINFCKCDITTKYQDKRDRVNSTLDTIKQRIIEVRTKDDESKWRSPLTGYMVMNLLGVGQGRIIGEIKGELDPKLKNGEITLEDAIEYIKKKWL